MIANTFRRPAGRRLPRWRRPELTLVWIDSREAQVVRDHAGEPSIERVMSDVPPHHRSTGHVRFDASSRHGGAALTSGEPRRLEHMSQFVRRVARRLPLQSDVLVIGPGTVRDRLSSQLRGQDKRSGVRRDISCEPAARLTRRQLVARYRRSMGAELRRRTPPVRRRRRSQSEREA
jgi:hypothetical protein